MMYKIRPQPIENFTCPSFIKNKLKLKYRNWQLSTTTGLYPCGWLELYLQSKFFNVLFPALKNVLGSTQITPPLALISYGRYLLSLLSQKLNRAQSMTRWKVDHIKKLNVDIPLKNSFLPSMDTSERQQTRMDATSKNAVIEYITIYVMDLKSMKVS